MNTVTHTNSIFAVEGQTLCYGKPTQSHTHVTI